MTSTSFLEPGLLDRVDLLLLRVAKRRREPFSGQSSFYDVFFAERDLEKYVRDVQNRWRFSLIDDVLRQLFPDEGPEILDVGCGLGVARRKLSIPRAYLGVDISSRTIELARELHPDAEPDFCVGSLPNLPLASASVDAAICLEVLEHLEDDSAALRELGRIIRPGGFLIVSVPGTYYWPAYRELIGHFRHYTPESLGDVLAEGGFDVVENLPQFRRFWRLYHYAYVLGLAAESLSRSLTRRDATMYRTRTYEALSRVLLRSLRERPGKTSKTSTFVVARRCER
jgi:SAM-dependent methyltransferase